MSVCKKSLVDMSFATFVLLGIAGSTGLSMYGIYNRDTTDKSESTPQFDTAIYLGNGLATVFAFAAIGILFYGQPTTMVHTVLAILIVFGVMLDFYLSILVKEVPQDIATYFFMAMNTLVRIVAVMIGYGSCTIPSLIRGGRMR